MARRYGAPVNGSDVVTPARPGLIRQLIADMDPVPASLQMPHRRVAEMQTAGCTVVLCTRLQPGLRR